MQPTSVSERVKMLVQRYVGIDEAGDSAYISQNGDSSSHSSGSSARVRAAHDLCMRIISSRMSSSIAQDEVLVADAIKKRLLRSEASTEKALQFSILFQKLQSRRKWSILHFLNLLASQNAFSDDFSVLDQSFATAGNYTFPSFSRASEPQQPAQQDQAPSGQPRLPKPEVSQPSLTGYERYLESTKDRFRVTEAELLRDLMYVFQGIDGKFIRYSTHTSTYRLDATILVPQSVRDLVEKLAELGWMYRRLSQFLNEKANDAAFGLVGQSFCSALRKELAEYYRLIAVLESQIASASPEKGDDKDDDGNDEEPSATATKSLTQRGLTLKRLLVWSVDPLCRLQIAVSLVDSCHDHKGGALVSIVHTYVHHGDPTVSSFACEPFFTMLRAWVHEGELVDPYDEFFVAVQPGFKEDQWWKSKYTCRAAMIPEFMSKGLAKKVFDIGKSLNFLRFCCNDVDWVAEQSRRGDALHAVSYDDLDTLEASIDDVYTSTTKRVTRILYEKYALQSHLLAMKKYLLLGQGDFIQVLMDSVTLLLSKPASTLHRHNLTSNLETAVRSSNAQFDSANVLKRLDLRIAETNPGDQGWDVFGLDYHVDMPINTIFSAHAMKKYYTLFHFLFKLKRVEYTLSRGWQRQIKHARLLASLTDTEDIAQVSRIQWSEMLHLIYQFQYYIQFEVIECAWAELMAQADQLKGGLDDLIAAHNRFLNSILSKGLLVTGPQQQLTPRLESIFKTVLAFKNAQEELYEYATIEHDIVQRDGKSKRQRQLNAAWGLVDSEYDSGVGRYAPSREHHKNLQDIVMRIQTTAGNFKHEAQGLITLLANHPDDNMKLLSFRLNFNEYYRTDGGGDMNLGTANSGNPFAAAT
ncbi:Microtubule-nucleating Tub4p (gamma-tubulin) complex component [Sorochytrium milnesiophthora]